MHNYNIPDYCMIIGGSRWVSVVPTVQDIETFQKVKYSDKFLICFSSKFKHIRVVKTIQKIYHI